MSNFIQPNKNNTFPIEEWYKCGCLLVIVDGKVRMLPCKDHNIKLSQDPWV